ncbi:MAG: hypothetical protein E4H14_14500 [Candidatus Thorarchaeota archaeon]|nr:MAG: hypothetical protein E4H14_14500 [Candidatus Thorarchaeota archaeon]
MAEIKIDALLKNIEGRITSYADLPWLSNYTDIGNHRPDGPPENAPSFQEIGKWLVVVVIFKWEGTTMDQSTDRLSGDPYYSVIRYDWIGLLETAPAKVKTPEELDEWAIHSLKYVRENTDAGAWGVHVGSYIEQMTKDGKLVIRDQKGSYQDENPETTGELRTIQLE